MRGCRFPARRWRLGVESGARVRDGTAADRARPRVRPVRRRGDAVRPAGGTAELQCAAAGGVRDRCGEGPSPGRGLGNRDPELLIAVDGVAVKKSVRQIAVDIHSETEIAAIGWDPDSAVRAGPPPGGQGARTHEGWLSRPRRRAPSASVTPGRAGARPRHAHVGRQRLSARRLRRPPRSLPPAEFVGHGPPHAVASGVGYRRGLPRVRCAGAGCPHRLNRPRQFGILAPAPALLRSRSCSPGPRISAGENRSWSVAWQ